MANVWIIRSVSVLRNCISVSSHISPILPSYYSVPIHSKLNVSFNRGLQTSKFLKYNDETPRPKLSPQEVYRNCCYNFAFNIIDYLVFNNL